MSTVQTVLEDREGQASCLFLSKSSEIRVCNTPREIDARSHRKHRARKQHYYGGVALVLTRGFSRANISRFASRP